MIRSNVCARTLAAMGVLVLAGVLGACSKADGVGKKGAETVPVVIGVVTRQSVPLRVEGIGNIESMTTVSVKSRVDGQIVKAMVADGALVTQGQVLFEIDPRPFVAQLRQAEATLARDLALLERARSQDARYQDLLKKNFVSPENYSQIRVNLDSALATVDADRAAVENVRLLVDYATIRSPINGRLGKISIPQGNLVKANDTLSLVTINQMSPIYVNFAIPEPSLGDVRRAMGSGSGSVPLPVDVSYTTTNSQTVRARGKVAFIDNTVDTTTGTVKLRAVLDNRDGLLWPGQFVQAAVLLGEQDNVVVIPSQAVQTGPAGSFVFVVDPQKMTVAVRPIGVERISGAIAIIAKGLAPGEKIVVDGQSRLLPGSSITAKPEPKAS
jgi:multidrug efflux system membrane fusion protein